MKNLKRVFVGVDWATQEHQACVLDEDGAILREIAVPHTAVGLAGFCDEVVALVHGDPSRVGVAIEVSHGIVVETLLERGMRVHAINPKQLDRFRDRFSMSGAKDDRRDARVLADSLRTDGQAFRLIEAADPEIIELREWSRMWDELQHEHNQLTNRFREQLRRYYPQFIELGGDLGAAWAIALWRRVPSPQRAAKVGPGAVQTVLKSHRIRRLNAATALAMLRQPAMTVAPGTPEAAQAHIGLLCERLAVVNDQLKTSRKRLTELLANLAAPEADQGQEREQRDVMIAQSLPGVGPIVLATLLAEAWGPLRDRDYLALRALSGIAPVTKRSGKSIQVVMRHGCNGRLRNALYQWTRVATQRDPLAKAKYAALRARGHSHGRALRSVGDRLLNILCAMLRDQTHYQEPQAAA